MNFDTATQAGINTAFNLGPATVLTPQTVAGPLLLSGGDTETQALSVTNQVGLNQLVVNKDAQIKDLRGIPSPSHTLRLSKSHSR